MQIATNVSQLPKTCLHHNLNNIVQCTGHGMLVEPSICVAILRQTSYIIIDCVRQRVMYMYTTYYVSAAVHDCASVDSWTVVHCIIVRSIIIQLGNLEYTVIVEKDNL